MVNNRRCHVRNNHLRIECSWLWATFLTLVLLLCTTQAARLVMQPATFQWVEVFTNELNSIEVLMLNVHFNQPIYLGRVPVTNLSAVTAAKPMTGTSDQLCWPPFGCQTMKQWMLAMEGVVELTCDGEKQLSYPAPSGNSDNTLPNFLLGAPPTKNPLLSMLADFGFLSEDPYPEVRDNQLSFLLLNRLRQEGEDVFYPITNYGRRYFTSPDGGSTPPAALQEGRCTVRMTVRPDSHGALVNARDSAGFFSPVLTSTSSFKQVESSKCNYEALKLRSEELRAFILNVSTDSSELDLTSGGASWNDLERSLWQVGYLFSTDEMSDCDRLLNSVLEREQTNQLVDSTECTVPKGSVEWEDDPCCNPSLLFEQCCAPRPVQRAVTLITGLKKEAEAVVGGQTCPISGDLNLLLKDYVATANAGIDPRTGCAASARRIASDGLFDEFQAFTDECIQAIYGPIPLFNGPACEEDSDCYSPMVGEKHGVCDTAFSRCYVPWFDPEPALWNCFVDRMQPIVNQFMRRRFGLLDGVAITPEEFYEAFKNSDTWSENCIGYTSSLYTFSQNSAGENVFQIADQFLCLDDRYCNWNAALTGELADFFCFFEEGFFCAECYSDVVCFETSQAATCLLNNVLTRTECRASRGSWNPDLQLPCTLLSASGSREDCLPPSVCPSLPRGTESDLSKTYCGRPFCFSTDEALTPALCLARNNQSTASCPLTQDGVTQDAYYYYWDETLASGNGLCLKNVPRKTDCETATAPEWQWWPGRHYQEELYTSQEACERGACFARGRRLPNSDGLNCEEKIGCTSDCAKCASTTASTLCLSKDIDQVCDCQHDGGFWVVEEQVCVYPNLRTEEECTAQGYIFQGCDDLTMEECEACYQYGKTGTGECIGGDGERYYQSLLSCARGWRVACNDQQECENNGGSCNDADRRNPSSSGCDFSERFIFDEFCFSSCISNFTITEEGTPSCPGASLTNSGCSLLGVRSREQCEATGIGEWHTTSFRQQETCLAERGCADEFTESISILSARNEEECSKCGGERKPIYTWTPSQWQPSTNRGFTWKERTIEYSNTWRRTLDYNRFKVLVSQLIADKLSLATQTEAMCNYFPRLQALEALACSCAGDGSKSKCLSGLRGIAAGLQFFCNGIPDTLRTGPLEIAVIEKPTDISSIISCFEIEVTVLSASQFEVSADGKRLSSSLLSQSTSERGRRSSNPYATILNKNGVVVGQLLGDGASLEFDDYKVTDNFTLCVDGRPDISKDTNAFSVYDFALYDSASDKWTPLNANVTLTEREESGRDITAYCIYTATSGTYFPIYRMLGWETAENDPLFTEEEEIALWILSAIYFCIALLSIASLAYNFKNGFFLIITVQRVILLLLIIFALVRGIFLALQPNEEVEDLSDWLFTMFSELPMYIFFTIYSLLIFHWVHMVSGRDNTFLGVMRYPFIIVNTLVYLSFIIVLIIYEEVIQDEDQDVQEDVNRAYVTVISCVVVIVLVFFWAYGGRLLYLAKATAPKKVLIRVTLVLLTCSIGLVMQFTFLLVITFRGSLDFWITIAHYLCFEILSCLALLTALWKPPSKRAFKSMQSSRGQDHKTTSKEKGYSSAKGAGDSGSVEDGGGAAASSAVSGGGGVGAGSRFERGTNISEARSGIGGGGGAGSAFGGRRGSRTIKRQDLVQDAKAPTEVRRFTPTVRRELKRKENEGQGEPRNRVLNTRLFGPSKRHLLQYQEDETEEETSTSEEGEI